MAMLTNGKIKAPSTITETLPSSAAISIVPHGPAFPNVIVQATNESGAKINACHHGRAGSFWRFTNHM